MHSKFILLLFLAILTLDRNFAVSTWHLYTKFLLKLLLSYSVGSVDI